LTDASDYLPKTERPALTSLRRAAQSCRGCELYRSGTQTVFGEGSPYARLVLLGEQPGDREDREGEPFVGPAGRLLDELLERAGIERADTYVTNAVKHFRWREGRGKRRIHQSPSAEHVRSCRPWLEAELRAVDPDVLLCLGATAAKTVFGPSFRVTQERGRVFPAEETRLDGADGLSVAATLHPSALLRIDSAEERRVEEAAFVDDLRAVAKLLG
jgi:DNA polymerase